MCIGAPHPNVEALRRDAELLTQECAIDAGGTEYSTRHNAPNPPVYRSLEYEDHDGQGRAVPTKHYSGLVGELFRETREKELVQVVHRIRAILADEPKHAYLLTNVPTELPVDEVCSFAELTDPVRALVPVADGALELSEHVEAAVAGHDAPDGFRAENLVEHVGGEQTTDGEAQFRVSEFHQLARYHGMDVSEMTVRRWVDDLEEIGLVAADEYEHRRGVPYRVSAATFTQALSLVHCSAGGKWRYSAGYGRSSLNALVLPDGSTSSSRGLTYKGE